MTLDQTSREAYASRAMHHGPSDRPIYDFKMKARSLALAPEYEQFCFLTLYMPVVAILTA